MATASASAEKKVPRPPYGAFKTFRAFIDHLKSTVLPDTIDRSMMTKMSGVTQSEIFTALRFFRLVTSNDSVTTEMRELVASFGTDDWPKKFAKIVRSAYGGIIGDLNITNATAKQFSDKFKTANLDSYMLERALRFYLAAVRDAKISVSPLFKVKSTRPNGSTHSKKNQATTEDTKNGQPPATRKVAAAPEQRKDIPPSRMIEHQLFFKGKPAGCIRVPENLSKEDCKVIRLTLAVIEAYAAQEGDTASQ